MQPNLYILGFPKCGTSALFKALNSHPQILGSNPKETFYLMDSDSPFYKENSFNNYATEGWNDYFYDIKDDSVKYFMEATTHNIFQNTALNVVSQVGSKQIVLLRDPAERIWSSFSYTKNNFGNIDKAIEFSRYVQDLLNKEPMNYIKSENSHYVLSRELDYSDYFKYLEKWKEPIANGQMYIGLFEEFIETPQLFFDDLCGWLDIPKYQLTEENNKSNATFKPRYFYINQTMAKLNRKFGGYSFVKALKNFYLKNLVGNNIKSQNDLEALDKLSKHFKNKNQQLFNAFGISDKYWSSIK